MRTDGSVETTSLLWQPGYLFTYAWSQQSEAFAGALVNAEREMSEHVEKIHRVVEWLVESNQVYDHSAEVIFSNHLPTPPPSCHNMEDGSPRKRPRATDNDLERTPTPGSSVNSLAYRLPQPPVLPHTYTRSESSRTSSRTSNRSSSPTKSIKKFRLQALEKPVLYEDLDEDVGKQLPYDVQELHKRIDEIVVLRSAFLPGSIREEVCSALGRQVPDSWFTAPQPSDDRDKALEELRQLKGIVLESRRSRELGRGESGLNWKVHEPFLKLALEQYDGMVESEPATDARILPAFIPMTEGTKIPTESKIDIAIVLSPTATGGDKHLADSIRRAVMSEPDGKKSSSHTNYQPLNFRPPATFIETKATGSADEGRTQLGIFVLSLIHI